MIDDNAYIEKGARVDPDANISAFCHIGKDVNISEAIMIEPHVCIYGNSSIGRDSHIYPHAKLGAKGSILGIGSNTTIREFTQIGTKEDKASIDIGDDCYIMGHSKIGEGSKLGNHITLTNSTDIGKFCTLHDKVIVGGLTTIANGITIGTCAMIGGASKVVSNIPPYTLVAGYPQAKIRGLNIIGMKRNSLDSNSIKAVKRAFMLLRKKSFCQDFAREILLQTEDKHARMFIDFVCKYDVE